MAELKAEWMARADLAALVAALGAGNVRWVGGAVRDTLLGHPVKDIDAASPLTPDEVMARLTAAGIRHVPTGLDHGTVTAVLPGGPVEITTLRKDVSTDGRRATVAFSDDWREDAARRDFTINALYADPQTGEIFDWFDGLADLEARRVRFIGGARERICEDHLRILRYYRFHARFGATIDKEAEKACVELAPMLKGLSRERVGWELLALLALPDPVDTVRRMHESGVLDVVLPEAAGQATSALAALVQAENAADRRGLPAARPGRGAARGRTEARLAVLNPRFIAASPNFRYKALAIPASCRNYHDARPAGTLRASVRPMRALRPCGSLLLPHPCSWPPARGSRATGRQT